MEALQLPSVTVASGGYPFAFFSIMLIIQFFVVLFTFPKTKDVTLEEIQTKLGVA